MKWGHTVCRKYDFRSEWIASQDALDLAFTCGTVSPSYESHIPLFPSSKPACGHDRKVTFSENVELIFASQDGLCSSCLTLSEEVFVDWPDKPWKLSGTNLPEASLDPLSETAV